jgi:hypothetical protein
MNSENEKTTERERERGKEKLFFYNGKIWFLIFLLLCGYFYYGKYGHLISILPYLLKKQFGFFWGLTYYKV